MSFCHMDFYTPSTADFHQLCEAFSMFLLLLLLVDNVSILLYLKQTKEREREKETKKEMKGGRRRGRVKGLSMDWL